MRGGLIAATTVGLTLCASATAWATFDNPGSADPDQQFEALPAPAPYGPNVQRNDTPNDPDYDKAEPDDPTPGVTPSTNLYDEQFDLFGFASALTRLTAKYSQGAHVGKAQISGFNAAGAWKVSRGRPDVQVAILDTGINWDQGGLRTKVALNQGELPKPQKTGGVPCADYDCLGNGDGFNVDDYAEDPRVSKADGAAQSDSILDASDLIHNAAFANGTDSDDNGYVDDIAGWDFFNDDNDPQDTSSYFQAGDHGSGRTNEAVRSGNDGDGEIGVCPKCTFVPLRVWDTFVSDQNNFFTAATYAADNGVEVIEGADGGLYHSSFAEKASQYVYEHGASQVYSGDDLNTANHNYPAAYDHTMLIEGTVPDSVGLGQELPSQDGDPGIRDQLIGILQGLNAGTELPVVSYFRGANTTQFGGHSSISMEGTTGSQNTGKAAGAVALVISAARDHGMELSPDEVRSIVEQTAEDVLPGNTAGAGTPDPSQPGFDTHFGYGRADVGAAAKAAAAGNIPPEASIESPDWYAPLTGSTARITGLARARGDKFTWRLEVGPGLAPTAFTTVRTGSSNGDGDPVTDFGDINLDEVRTALAANGHPDCLDVAGPTLNCATADPFQGQFTVRVVVDSDDAGVTLDGVDRKVLTAIADPTLRPSFPKRLGAGGEAPLRYADLNGDNQQELVLPTEDGRVHAYRPNGTELTGWPVQTERQSVAIDHLTAPAFTGGDALDPPLEPPRAPTIADITGDGKPEVITAAGERIYVWESDGKPLNGWPVRPDPTRANCATSEQDKQDDLKHPKCGFLATPVIAHLEGKAQPPDIAVPGLDGVLRAYRPAGTPVPGFPVRLRDSTEAKPMTAESINNPAVGDLDGDGKDDLVVATNEVYGAADPGDGDVNFGGLLAAAGSQSRVYAVKSGGTSAAGGPFFDGWPVKPSGLIQNVLPLIGPGHDPLLVKDGDTTKIVVSVTGSTIITVYDTDGENGTKQEIQQSAGGQGALNLFESSVVGDLDGSGPGGIDVVKYQLDLPAAANLLLVGQNVPYSHRIGAYDLSTGTKTPAFPVITDDYQFLSSSTIANVAGGASNQVVAGTGLGLLHAYDGLTGQDAPGFPKVTGGWLFAPAAVSDDGRLAAVTREGFLFEWDAEDTPACQTEWPSFRHDPQGTGNYDADGTAPGAPGGLTLTRLDGNLYRLAMTSPGDDGACGTADKYVADVNGTPIDLGPPVAGGGAFSKTIALPAGAAKVTVKAVDEVGNAGHPASVQRAPDGGGFTPVPPAGGTKGGGGGGSNTQGLRKPRLKLVFKYRRRGRTRTGRRCGRAPVRITVAGADRRLVRRARFRIGARGFRDSRPPLSRVYRDRHLGPSHVHRAKLSVRLKDGRLVRLSKRFRVCAQG